MPDPTPVTIAVADQVNASVMYAGGACRETSNVAPVIDGAIIRPATNASGAIAHGPSTNRCSAIGTASRLMNRGSCLSTGIGRCKPPYASPPSALPTELIAISVGPHAADVRSEAKPG